MSAWDTYLNHICGDLIVDSALNATAADMIALYEAYCGPDAMEARLPFYRQRYILGVPDGRGSAS